jgi:hypothetical protein
MHFPSQINRKTNGTIRAAMNGHVSSNFGKIAMAA